MSSPAVFVDHRRLRLGPRLGKGGEGEVFSLESDAVHAVKLYTVTDLEEREVKVEAMIRDGMARQAPQVAFPLSVVRDEGGRFAGFLMRNVLRHKPLHELYSPGSRKIHFPEADYRFLVRTAQNISKAVASIHAIGCVIGDINQSSILVSQSATVALIDSDSFQVNSGARQYLCRVGVPEYTPPELQGSSLAKVARSPNHDAFGLAIVVFQLLFMGRHPFVGSVRRGDIPALHESIRDFRFVYTENRDVGMDQPPGTPALSDFPRSVALAFEAAFGRASQDSRPSSLAWIDVLAELEQSLVQCRYQKMHWHPVESAECPWCTMERELGAQLFVSEDSLERVVTSFDPGAGGFDLAAVWRGIAAFNVNRLAPVLPSIPVQVSPLARLAKWRGYAQVAKLRRSYLAVEQEWLEALAMWRSRTGVAAADDLLGELHSAKTTYESLPSEEKAQFEAYERDRRERQLLAFLGQFEIRRALLRGIGAPEEAVLASFGIETAADITSTKLLRVPGLSQDISKVLYDWRKRLQNRFAYDPRENALDRQELARIRAAIEHQAAQLRRTLLSGRANLDRAWSRVAGLNASADPDLVKVHEKRAQLRVDLQYLGVDLATLSGLAANSNHLTSAPARAIAKAASGAAGPSNAPPCPRCGSQMLRRLTKHKAAAAQQFWGCVRHPLCRGTRI